MNRVMLGVLVFVLCAGSGCATRVTSIGEVSERPLIKLKLPGMELSIHSLEATFEHGENAPDPVEAVD